MRKSPLSSVSRGDTSREEILRGGIIKTILHLAYPIFIAMSFQTLFNFVDTYYVSRLGPQALASMGLTFPFFMLTVALTQGMAVGTSSLVARSMGAVDEERIRKVAGGSISLAILAGILFAFLGLLLYPYLLVYMGAEDHIAVDAGRYLKIMFLFLPLKFLLLSIEGLFRGEGKTSLSMKIMLLATLSNIIIDPLLIFGLGPFPSMGIAGAALATAISWLIGILSGLYFFYTSRSVLPLSIKSIGFVTDIYGRLIRVGLPASLSTGTMSISMFFLNRFAYQFGHQVVAAYAIGFRVDTLTILPGLSIAAAAIAMVGQNYGAREFHRARQAHQSSSLLAFLVMAFFSLIIFLFPRALASIFIADGREGERVLLLGIEYLRIVVISYPFLGLGFVSNSSFQAMGLGLPSFLNALLRFFILTLPVAYLLAFILDLGPLGIWLGIAVANIFFGLFSYFWVSRFLSKVKEKT